jgi:malate dehydrogenase
MLRCIIHGQSEVQPVVAIIENEYGLIQREDNLDSISFGVPAKIGSNGVEKIYELPVDDIRDQLMDSAGFIKEDIRHAASILKEKFSIM